MNLEVAVNNLTVFLKWLDEYREHGFESALVTAREVAEEVGVYEMTFKTTRPRRKKKCFDYEANDESTELTPKDKFKIEYFYVVVDQIWTSCEPRFEALKLHESLFGFLYRIKDISKISDKNLMDNCKDLQVALSVGDQHDIEGIGLFEELKIFSHVMAEEEEREKKNKQENNQESGIIAALKYIVENNLSDIYPNLSIALRIVATIPVTVAAAERSFSKLKLIKTYLRNTMTQDRLSALGILSIENELASSLDYNGLIEDFSQKKSRRVHF